MRYPERHLIAISLMAILFAGGCKKGSGTTDPTSLNNGFKGITQTSDSPDPTGWIDRDDWKSDGSWNYKYPVQQCGNLLPKSALVSGDTSAEPIPIKPVPIVPATIRLYPAYPNPGGPSVAVEFDLSATKNVYLAIIRDDYRIVAVPVCHQLLPAGRFLVYWDGTDDAGNHVPLDVYRYIFLVTNPDGGFAFASHGDVWVNY